MKFVAAIFFVLFFCMAPQRLDAARPAKEGEGLDKIEQACAQTKYKDLCITSLTSDPNSFPADKKELAMVALRLAASNASDISENIKVLLNDTAAQTQKKVQQALFDCLDEYLDASQQLDHAIAALIAKAYGDVDKRVNAAMSSVRACGMEFGKHTPSLLVERNGEFIKLCEIAQSISKIAEV